MNIPFCLSGILPFSQRARNKDLKFNNKKIMGGAILTRREEQFKKELEAKLQEQIKEVQMRKEEGILNAQNSSIKKINKLNIEYKYDKATKSMIHDGGKSQAMSMLGALRYVGILT